jgi:glucosamine--fructose-6-phosphate aminotransferase (isomerizing)
MGKGKHTKREIEAQPSTWKTVLSKNRKRLEGIVDELSVASEIIFFGAGTSYYLALSASTVFQKVLSTNTKALPSSELINFPEAHVANQGEGKLFVGFSRSGETTETVEALNKVKHADGSDQTLAISCYPESPLIKESDLEIVTEAAQEESVVMTQSFTSMLLTSYQLATMAGEDGSKLSLLPELGEVALEKSGSLTKELLNENFDHYVFLGSGPHYGVACESMLKMKETALENTEAFHALEFRHGPKSTVGSHSLVTMYLTENGREHEKTLLSELDNLDATTVAIGGNLSQEIKSASHFFTDFRAALDQYFQGILFIPFAQYLGTRVALKKDIDPDEPRNLSQVVHL